MPTGNGTKVQPWQLKTPPGTSDYTAYRDETLTPPALVVQVGKTELRYDLRATNDLHAMLRRHGDWMPLGSAHEQKPAAAGTVEAWGHSPSNPVKGWYGLKIGPPPLPYVPPAGPRGLGAGRGRAQPPEQPHADALNPSC